MRFQRILAMVFVALLILSGLIIAFGSSRDVDETETRNNFEDEQILFAGGNGTESDPYEISNVTQLQNMNQNLSAHYELVNDIDANATQSWNNGSGFVPIGDDNNNFIGTLDGQGYNITSLYINRSDTSVIGMFGEMGMNASVNELALINATVIGNSYVGGLVGINEGFVNNSYLAGDVIGKNNDIGGLVGHNDGTVLNCCASAGVKGESYDVGGLVGENGDTVSYSYATGNVDGEDDVGGLVGYNEGVVSSSYASGNVTGVYYIGGLIGQSSVEVKNSYAVGNVTGSGGNIGGLVGFNGGTVSNSFWDVNTTGRDSSQGGTGKTTAEMKNIETFVDTSTDGLNSAWDFGETWWILGGSIYPQLRRFNTPPKSASPNQPVNLNPKNNTQGIYIPTNLSVKVYDPNKDSMNVTFYSENGTQIGATQNNISHNGTASIVWTGLSYKKNYTWYAKSEDGYNTTKSTTWTFETECDPNVPFDPNPVDEKINVQTSPELSVSVRDPQGDKLDVRFYKASDDSLIAEDVNVSSGGRASVTWNGLDRYTTYGWYAIADDGINTTRSPTWNFTTLPFIGGNGTEDNPYLIENVTQLQYMSKNLTAHYRLANDIDAGATKSWNNGSGFKSIGVFTGSLDGQGYNISGLFINRTTSRYVGLFGDSDGNITDVGVINANISGDRWTGSLIGFNSGTVSGCFATGKVAGGISMTGGLVGRNSVTGTINSSYTYTNVSGENKVGGLVGENSGMINDSFGAGYVESGRDIGGLVGVNWGMGKINNSYYTGNVSGNENAGGLIGRNSGTVSNSHYNINNVLINGGHHLTMGGLFHNQYQDWISSGKTLQIEDYSNSLIPSGENYEIYDIQGIKYLLGFVDEEQYNFSLVADLDLSQNPGLYIPYLEASFDGNGHIVNNLSLQLTCRSRVGFCGYLATGASLSDIGIVNFEINGGSMVGGVAGENRGIIKNSYATGNGSLFSSRAIGGLVGINGGKISNSYARANVEGDWGTGGLVGRNYEQVINTYATGKVTDGYDIGGLIALNYGTVKDSFWDINTTGQSSSAGGTGKTTEEMKDVSTFTNESSEGLNNSWDFVGNPNNDTNDDDIWDINASEKINNGYPFLKEFTAANTAPTVPTDPSPADGATSVSTSPTLGVDVSDPDGDSMNVTFYNASDDSVIDSNFGVTNGTTSVTWSGLSVNTTYEWYAVANDSQVESQSPTWSFTTETINSAPDAPGEPTPADGANAVSTSPTLSVDVSDPDGDTMTVTFYNASDDSVIGPNSGVANGTTSVTWSNLSHDTTYGWYIVANDSQAETQSPTWSFTTIVEDDQAPTADAGEDRTVDEDTTVTFNGSGSTDNVGITDYTWTIEGSEYSGMEVQYTFNEPGNYTVTLNVSDGAGNYDTDTVNITVQDVTDPTADAGDDQTVAIGEQFILNASGSSDNVGIVNYTWIIQGTEYYGMEITHSFSEVGTYTITLNVTDAAGNYDTDTVTVTVEDQTSPTAVATANQTTVNVGDPIQFDASDSSDNVEIINYSWDFGDVSMGSNKTTTHSYIEAGNYTVTLTVRDAAGNSDTDTINITVEEEAQDTEPPVAKAGDNKTVDVGENFTLDASRSSDNMGIENYTWTIKGEEYHGEQLTYNFSRKGNYTVTLTVEDVAGNTDTDTVNITVEKQKDTDGGDETGGEGGTEPGEEGTSWMMYLIPIILIIIVIAGVLYWKSRGTEPPEEETGDEPWKDDWEDEEIDEEEETTESETEDTEEDLDEGSEDDEIDLEENSEEEE